MGTGVSSDSLQYLIVVNFARSRIPPPSHTDTVQRIVVESPTEHECGPIMDTTGQARFPN